MTTRTAAAGGLLALVALALAAVIASFPMSTQAASRDLQPAETPASPRMDISTDQEITNPEEPEKLQAVQEGQTDTKPYIGVVISPAADGGVSVVRVLKGGPSDGVLESGDVITAANGEAVEDTQDLIDVVGNTDVGTDLTLTVTRDGTSMDLTVTVGERETVVAGKRWSAIPEMAKRYDHGAGLLKQAYSLGDSFSSIQMVVDGENGYETHRVVAGTVTTIDAGAGTFTLQPRDASDPIQYMVTDETKVNMDRMGDIGGLNTTDVTYVHDVDAEVKYVHQGDPGMTFGPKMGSRDYAPRSFRNLFRGGDLDAMIPPEIRERLEQLDRNGRGGTWRFRFGSPSDKAPDDSGVSF